MSSAVPRPALELDVEDVIKVWPQRRDRWLYVSVPDKHTAAITAGFETDPRGFRSVPVTARIDDEKWRTALFRYQDGTWALPLKAEVRRRHRLEEGRTVRVRLAVR